MSANQEAAMAPGERAQASSQIINNPLSGEQITIQATSADTGGRVLEWELLPGPGGEGAGSPAPRVRGVTRPAAWLGRRRGLDARYRRLRTRGPGRAPS